MNEEQLERYCRQIVLPEIDIAGQEKLLRSRVLIIGMGGLGAPAAMYIASGGVGRVVICDDDHVELNNLQRQIIHTSNDLGRHKVDSAFDTLQALNPGISVDTINKRLHKIALNEQVRLADVVIDASDNFDTRFELNMACIKERTPLVSGAVTRLTGQVSVFRNDHSEAPCYQCLYPDIAHENCPEEDTCREVGILAPVAGIIGTIVATETLKLLLNLGNIRIPYLLKFDALGMTWQKINLIKDPKCPACSHVNQNKRLPINGMHGVAAL